MASYNGRRAPNVSQYIANLNTIPSAQELSAQSDFPIDAESLDFLTNTEFFDFDTFNGEVGDFPPPAQPQEVAQKPPGSAGMSVNGPQYQFGEFQTYPSIASSPNTMSPSPAIGLQGAYPTFPHGFQSGDKRKASAAGMGNPADLEETSRVAAEEDKRRRNTAASARFRVKKKQREQALEKQAKELSDKVQLLENRVQQLETENKWLKELITEKSNGEKAEVTAIEPTSGNDAAKDVPAAQEKEGEERSTESRTVGVGTAEEVKVEA